MASCGLRRGMDGDPDFQEVKGEDSRGRSPSRPQAGPCRIMSTGVFNCAFSVTTVSVCLAPTHDRATDIRYSFLFSIYSMLWIWESYRPRERLPFPGLADSYREAQPSQEHPFHTRTNQHESTTPTTSSSASHTPSEYCPCPKLPRDQVPGY